MLRSRCQSRFEVRMISSDLTPRHRLGQIAPFVGVPPSKSSASGVLRAIRAGTERLRADGFDRLVNLRSGQKSLPTTSLLACLCTDQRSVRTFPSCGTRWLEACSFCGRVTPVHSGDSGHMTMSMTRHKTTRLGSVLLATFGFSALALSGAARADQIHFERGVGSNQEWKQMYRVAEPNMHDVLQRYGGHWDRFVTVTADAGREIVTHNDWVPDHGPGSVVAFVDQLYEIEDYQVLDGVIHLAYEPYGPPDNGSGPGLQPGGDGPSGPADPEPEDRHIPKGSESTSSSSSSTKDPGPYYPPAGPNPLNPFNDPPYVDPPYVPPGDPPYVPPDPPEQVPVPEPGTLLLFGTGLAALVCRQRRQR